MRTHENITVIFPTVSFIYKAKTQLVSVTTIATYNSHPVYTSLSQSITTDRGENFSLLVERSTQRFDGGSKPGTSE